MPYHKGTHPPFSFHLISPYHIKNSPRKSNDLQGDVIFIVFTLDIKYGESTG